MIDENDPDAPLKEVWEIRRRIMEEFGNDRERYHDYLVELQNSPELRDRVVTLDELERRRKHPAA
ncbi:MAG TPA: hypothetical protein VF541_06810 [Longimicrobium sp.]|jgi:hypothetical protein